MLLIIEGGVSATSEQAWQGRLAELLTRQTGDNRVVVVGLGHPLKGDDYVGSLIAKDLKRRIKNEGRIIVVDAEDSPENVINILNEQRPSLVVLIDAFEAGLEPGSVTLIDLSETTYPFFGSHSMPLKLLLEMGPEIPETVLLGIQPSSYEIGGPLSKAVSQAEAEIVMELGDLLQKVRG